MKTNVYTSPDKLATARLFADHLVELVKSAEVFHCSVSGGSTPKLLFDLLAKEYGQLIPWERVHFWWGDERCVPPTDSDSNYGMTKSLLFDHIDIPAENIHRVLGENDPEQEAIRYSEEMTTIMPMVDGLPQYDLIMLGMGDDGHTASIFPHQMELLKAEPICAVATHPTSGQKRITLTGPSLQMAKKVAFLVTGENKQDKVASILNEPTETSPYPAAHIQPLEGDLVWYLDEAAAAKIS
ncbi:6-phosphogluconolactonase [Pontibacter sp. G13]|uniref:6-phosphogluconolactonase n=1 Tax=Pontibacter sp. G13 TaxID=3074898 RepID=UPI00288A6A15|nr:6-phosphogluconolactonase [Pontibacter sp. G13]WNJ18236.1 6-phosphogluconolactonase [Pontibacter sp. G13]